MKYIALLREINISGKNKVPMKQLKTYLEDLNYKNVTTYLNSGNIIFDTNQEPNEIEKNITTILKDKLNVDTEIYITTKEILEELLNNQPKWWCKTAQKDVNKYITIRTTNTIKKVLEIARG